MDLTVPAVTLVALLLGTARAAGFVLMAPPFNSRTIPGPVKGALAMSLSLLLSTQIAPTLGEPTAGFLVVAAVTEVVIGAALGFVVQVLFTAVQMAGDLIDVTEIAAQTMMVAAKVAAPVLLTALLVGFLISLFQAATQIQEPTLSFVPKMIAVAVALLITGNWVLASLVDFTHHLFDQLPRLLDRT